MNILHKFLEEITPDYDVNHINQELENIDGYLLDNSFFEAVKFCMLKAYSFDESLDIILTVDYNYDYLKMCLDFLQNHTPIEPVDWNKFLSHFPKQKTIKQRKSKRKPWERPYKFNR
ncbi:MAG: hypothetical protein GY849_02210 [Deltaproteobacteria bacterium]|nr:hypothetical protein [Deltaproteobacteria bacterium]